MERWCVSNPPARCSCRLAPRPIWLSDAAIAGTGIVMLFEDWLRPHLDSGELEPVLRTVVAERFRGRFSTTPASRLLPAPLRRLRRFHQGHGG